MDWQSVLVNLVVSGIIAILLILVNWAINVWEQRSTWGRWRQVFLRYPQILKFYVNIENEKDKILEKRLTFGGILFILSLIFNAVEMVFVPLISSWKNLDPANMHSLLFGIFIFMQMFSIPSILSNAFIQSNSVRSYSGFRLMTYTVYMTAIGILIAILNLKRPFSEIINISFIEIGIVVATLLSGKRVEEFMFNKLWDVAIKSESFAGFLYITVSLKSGREFRGVLIDFMDKSGLVIKRGKEYIHAPWHEIEIVHVLEPEEKIGVEGA